MTAALMLSMGCDPSDTGNDTTQADVGAQADGGDPGQPGNDAAVMSDGSVMPDGSAPPDQGPSEDMGAAPDMGDDPDLGAEPDMGDMADQGVTPDMGIDPDMGTPECDPPAVLAAHGCANAGCHAVPVAAGLDLVADDMANRLVNAPAHSPGCDGRLIIDGAEPDRSLLLQVIGAEDPPGGDADACQVVMPPVGEVPEADRECLRVWVHDLASQVDPEPPGDPFDPTPIDSALRKAKTLLTGQSPTAEELAAVQADPAALRGLIDGWTRTPAFEVKLAEFMEVALQQRVQVDNREQFDRLRRNRTRTVPYRRILEESFVRTAVDIVSRGAPFTEILTTRRWMVTTANLVLLLYTEEGNNQRSQRHIIVGNPDEAPATLAEQVAQRTWYVEGLETTCDVPGPDALDMLFGFILARRCDPRPERNINFSNPPLTLEDFEDWRMVEFVPTNEALDGEVQRRFYDLPRLREADRVVTRLPRVGFFTTSSFFNNWESNADNQFRVWANQAVLGALHVGFGATEPTEPLSEDGLDPAHAAPDTACHGCHRHLDPMRLYFTAYGFDSQRARNGGPEEDVFDDDWVPSFAFRGHTADGGNLYRFADLLAEHPRFPISWTQKLCLWANAERCDENDPELQRLASSFADGGFDFRALVVDMMSSPLVTGLEVTETFDGREVPVSITRRAHLCALLDQRLGREGTCAISRVSQVIGLIPDDDFARGAEDFTQPALPSAFQFAAAEAVCEAVAASVINAQSEQFPRDDIPAAMTAMARDLMALPVGHPRHDAVAAELTAQYDAARALGQGRVQSLRAAFTLACLSPDVMGVGL
ncbi:MAG: hypothetical protein ACE366_03120 [Bradymonadia bacterium]